MANILQAPAAQTASSHSIPSCPSDLPSVVCELWERASDHLTLKELEWFAGATDAGCRYLQNLEEVISGTGCLIADDTRDKKGAPMGMFQNASDVSGLLFFLAESISHANALITVGNFASFRLRNPGLFSTD